MALKRSQKILELCGVNIKSFGTRNINDENNMRPIGSAKKSPDKSLIPSDECPIDILPPDENNIRSIDSVKESPDKSFIPSDESLMNCLPPEKTPVAIDYTATGDDNIIIIELNELITMDDTQQNNICNLGIVPASVPAALIEEVPITSTSAEMEIVGSHEKHENNIRSIDSVIMQCSRYVNGDG